MTYDVGYNHASSGKYDIWQAFQYGRSWWVHVLYIVKKKPASYDVGCVVENGILPPNPKN